MAAVSSSEATTSTVATAASTPGSSEAPTAPVASSLSTPADARSLAQIFLESQSLHAQVGTMECDDKQQVQTEAQFISDS